MNGRLIFIATLVMTVATDADARSFTGARGGSASTSVTQQGNHVSAQASGTTARGRSASASGSATYHVATGTIDGEGNVTGPQGTTYGGTFAAGDGSATVTGNNGAAHTFTPPQ